MSQWVSFGAAMIGGLVAGAAALGGVALAQRGETKRSRDADRRHLREAKAERLRRLYEPYVRFAMLLRQVANEQGYLMEGDTIEARNRRHQNQMLEGMQRISEVVAAATVEPGTATVRKAYEAAYRAADQYLRLLSMNAVAPGSTSLGDLTTQFDAVGAAADKLNSLVISQLDEFDKPI